MKVSCAQTSLPKGAVDILMIKLENSLILLTMARNKPNFITRKNILDSILNEFISTRKTIV